MPIMGLRFRRRLRLGPGVSLNLGKSGLTSVSFGRRGVHCTVGRRGPRATVGLPGTGLSHTLTPHHRARRRARHGSILGGVAMLFALYLIIRALVGN